MIVFGLMAVLLFSMLPAFPVHSAGMADRIRVTKIVTPKTIWELESFKMYIYYEAPGMEVSEVEKAIKEIEVTFHAPTGSTYFFKEKLNSQIDSEKIWRLTKLYRGKSLFKIRLIFEDGTVSGSIEKYVNV